MAIRRIQSAYAVVTVAAIGASAHADFTTAHLSSSTSYTFSISHMPDLDQERGGSIAQGALPNEGKYYCVPTSIMNLATYAANHGFAEVNPGPGSWSVHERYLLMSEYLGVLGNLMSTNPFTGTKHGPAAFGMNVWVTSSSDRLVIDHRARVGGWVAQSSRSRIRRQSADTERLSASRLERSGHVGAWLSLGANHVSGLGRRQQSDSFDRFLLRAASEGRVRLGGGAAVSRQDAPANHD
jgi:hypothetical protein